MGAPRNSLSVLMFPWLAHGHTSPCLEVAKKLSSRNFYIYICSTPINLASIKNKITENHSPPIQLVELHLPFLPDLPPQYHTTNGLPLHLHSTLKKALKMAKPAFSDVLSTLNPDLLIYDVMQPWAAAVASSHNVPALSFITSSAAMIAFFSHQMRNSGADFPFPAIYLRDYEVTRTRRMLESELRNEMEEEDERESAQTSSYSNPLILIKTFKEIDGKYIDYIYSLFNIKIVPVGHLVQEPPVGVDEKMELNEWLGKKEKSSTVFVSFGSEYFLSKEEMEEIAYGLELSNVNFIWVVRFPIGEKPDIQTALPEGFLDRVGDRGMLVERWAPQTRILAHSSVGGFVSHCGWNSVMESMRFGVPIIAIPMHLDQPLNARLVLEVGVGMEVVRDSNGMIHREEVAKVIREVVVERVGEGVRRKARELSENIKLKGEEEIDEVAEMFVQLCNMNKEKK